MKKISLGVNIDHAATLRQVRANTTAYPNLLQLTEECRKGGASQITIHLREDRRHIQDNDVILLCKKSKLPINLEMAVSEEMYLIAMKYRPTWVCFVPEKREELTTEGGLDVLKCFDQIASMSKMLNLKKIRVSFFIEPSLKQVQASFDAGAQAVEFHTGHWVSAKGKEKKVIFTRLINAATLAHSLGLRVHVGHGIDYHHASLIKKIPYVVEANIGHSLICYSLTEGLKKSVQKMKRCLHE